MASMAGWNDRSSGLHRLLCGPKFCLAQMWRRCEQRGASCTSCLPAAIAAAPCLPLCTNAAQPALTFPIASLQQEGQGHRLPLQLAGSDGLCCRRWRCRPHGMCALSRCSLCGRQVTDPTPLGLFSPKGRQHSAAECFNCPAQLSSEVQSPTCTQKHTDTHTPTLPLHCSALGARHIR